MKKKLFFVLVLVVFNFFSVFAQSGSVGIGIANPNLNASLDLGSSNKGLLPNRVALASTNVPNPLTAHVEGMVVYNTATAGTAPNNVAPGLYYNNGSQWIPLKADTAMGFSAFSAGTQPISAGQFITISDWVAQRNDFGSAFSNGIFTVPAGKKGWYNMSAAFRHSTGCSYNNAVYIQVNGNTIAIGNSYIGVNGGQINGSVPDMGPANTSASYFLNEGDQVKIIGYAYPVNCSTNVPITATTATGYTFFHLQRQ
ncbi:hypothetical protein [Chryseobacterium tongliaoense]|uniref:hypothetical protein n=1 Tax=Chryseobacterium tongliaoense TaxID=3240933 RepID=UPI0035151089